MSRYQQKINKIMRAGAGRSLQYVFTLLLTHSGLDLDKEIQLLDLLNGQRIFLII